MHWRLFAAACGLAALVVPSFAELISAQGAAKRTAALQRLQLEIPEVRLFRVGEQATRIYGVPFAAGVTAEDAFATFLARHGDALGTDQGTLVLERTITLMDGKFVAGQYFETIAGVPVDGAFVTLLAKDQIGYPIVLASNYARPVRGPLPQARVTAAQAILNLKKAHRSLTTFEVPTKAVWVGEASQHLAWRFHAENPSESNPERVLAFIDAVTGAILEQRQALYHTDINGSVKGWASPGQLPDQPNNPETLQNMWSLRVTSPTNQATTNASANFVLPNAGTTPVDVTANLTGPWVTVVNQAAATLSLTQNVTPPGPANFVFNPGMAEFDTAQINGFIQTNVVHDFAKGINNAYPGIDVSLPCNVNLANTCNAFYNGSSINFYRAGGGCPNTAYSSVVHHEYGHFIIDRGHPTASGDYHEGMSDVTSSLLADTPCLGQDFRGQGTGCLRNAINGVMHPCSGEAHLCGQVISGAFWLTLLELDATVGHSTALFLTRSWYLNSILLRPADISTEVTIDVLTLDDDDSNLNNGTPHFDEINRGFTPKGLGVPPIIWLAFNPMSVPGELVPPSPNDSLVPVVVRIENGVGTLNPNSPKLFFRVNNGAWQQTPMNEIADPAIYWGGIPNLGAGTAVDWYLEAKDTQNHTMRYPSNAPTGFFSFVVATSITTVFADNFESNLGWTVTNTALTSGAWVRADPVGTNLNGQPANPEFDSADPGAQCMFTGQGAVGGAVGAADVDGGPTVLTSPVFALAGADAFIEYRRWYFNDDGDDAFVVQVSNNGGASWVTVETVMGIANSWVDRRFRVGAFVSPTNSVLVRFSATDNPNNSVTEAGVDSFVVRKINF